MSTRNRLIIAFASGFVIFAGTAIILRQHLSILPAAVIFGLLLACVVLWVMRPYAEISASLESQDFESLRKWKNAGPELRLLVDFAEMFLEQKWELAKEAAERRRAQEALSISMAFINLPPEQIDSEINRSIGRLAEFAGAERGYIYEFSGDLRDVANTHEWAKEDIPAQGGRFCNLETDSHWGLVERLNGSKSVAITRTELPERGTVDRHILLECQEAEAVLLAPMTFRGSLIGFVGIDSITAGHQWSDSSAQLLRQAAEIFVGALERKDAEESLRESQERYVLAAHGAYDWLWDWNLKTGKVYYSTRWKSMVGSEEQDLTDSPDEWFSRVHTDDVEQLRAAVNAHIEGVTAHFEHEYRMRHADGDERWMLCRASAVKDVHGEIVRMAGSQTDITNRKRAEEQLRYNAFYDGLTGLPNRALFMDRLSLAIEHMKRYDDHQFAVLFLDLDHFKVINDSLGHIIGDRLLVAVAERLRNFLRSSDTVARLGGDEFSILIDTFNEPSQPVRIVERIEKELLLPFSLDGQEVFTAASIGVVFGKQTYDRPEELLRDADTAMYRAKALGRAGYAVFDSHLHARAVERLQVESDLRRAVDREEFRVVYQPVVATDTRRIVACEALVRWEHPERGTVAPFEFIPVAEETGLIIQIGTCVLRMACREVKRWNEAGNKGLRVAVNLSARQFQYQNLTKVIEAVLSEVGIDADKLELEITESITMQNLDLTVKTLNELNEMGIEIAIDDFGTGHSSLAYLKRFPIDTLKIDQSFIRGLPEDSENAAITSAIIAMTQNLQLNVRAEGVETDRQLSFLTDRRCREVQGFYFSRPVESKRILELLSAGPVAGENVSGAE